MEKKKVLQMNKNRICWDVVWCWWCLNVLKVRISDVWTKLWIWGSTNYWTSTNIVAAPVQVQPVYHIYHCKHAGSDVFLAGKGAVGGLLEVNKELAIPVAIGW